LRRSNQIKYQPHAVPDGENVSPVGLGRSSSANEVGPAALNAGWVTASRYDTEVQMRLQDVGRQ
jgi:hypothetical protein